MSVVRCGSMLLALMLPIVARPAYAGEPGMCRVVNVEFTPGGIAAGPKNPEIDPQIVAWLEKPSASAVLPGPYVGTIYITQQTGRYGMGNRPGRFDFNSGPNWPYGRRVTVFPVWAHRHGLTFPQINYQNTDDNNLSHPANDSSRESHFCRPLEQTEAQWDAATCSSAVFTDKGAFGSTNSVYPPRADVIPVAGTDSPSVPMYRAMNPFDAVSQATPRLGTLAAINWAIPPDLPTGDYVLFMEVALEQDFNTNYNPTRYPAPTGAEIGYSNYGVPYRGQPSVIYRVAFTISDVETIETTDTYIGYGDPGPDTTSDGKTPAYYMPSGDIHLPDGTIATGVPNTGASRLLLTSKDGQMFRVRVNARPEHDFIAPGMPGSMVAAAGQGNDVALSFVAPGDDGFTGRVNGYEVRYRVGATPITEADFASANEAKFTGTPAAAGELQTITIHDLLPETEYTFAVRAFDKCNNASSVVTATFTTAPPKIGEVDACFIATAAYGSVLANDVEMLRRFRDRMLKRSVLGELAVETYYTFGPTVAGVVGESDLLRSSARDLLAPVVSWVRAVR
ncbi:MAG TPA: fibronectin type III domain-containing protein [Kofleriaceae bacterium]